MTRRIIVVGIILMLAGCAAPVPPALRAPGVTRTSVVAARAHIVPPGVMVRWGGVIGHVTNGARATWLQIISLPLREDGRPRRSLHSGGRFLARINGFLDPDVYAVGREVTVVGTFSGFKRETIGHFPYDFPVVHVRSQFLWRPRPVIRYEYAAPWPAWGWTGPMWVGPGWGMGWSWGWGGPYGY
ncbi:MAG: Slp/YeaY family lipoprotein [Gammaproteobacteria bacterium]|nr:Slp/YeaY family lipoprotein [Gammaproteobacteria bacterium]